MRAFDLQPGLKHRGAGLGGAEKLALPKDRRGQKCGRVTRRRRDQRPKAQHIDREFGAMKAHSKAVRLDQVAVGAQHVAQFLQRLAQAAAGQCLGGRVPQQRGQLFTVHPAVGAEKQKPQQAAGLAGAKGDLLAIGKPDGTAASQKVDLKSRHSCLPWKHALG